MSKSYPRCMVVCICLLFFINVLYAQKERFYSTENGLSNSLINQIYQDKKGYIWIATENGLNKFDGIKVTKYNHIPTDDTSICNNYIHTLFEDNRNNLYIGTLNGLMKYDRAKDCFEQIKTYNGNNELVHPHIISIAGADDGAVWFTTSGEGLFIIQNEQAEAHPSHISQRLNSVYLNIIFIDSAKNSWIGSEKDGLNLYNPKTNTLKVFRKPSGINSDNISVIAEDSFGNIFVGTHAQGLYKYNKKNETFEAIKYKESHELSISSLLINDQKQLLIGTDGKGLKIYNATKNTIEDNEIDPTPFDFSKAKIHSLFADRDNNLWLGIFQKGILVIPSQKIGFDYFGYNSYKHNSIGSSCVMSVCKDKSDITWVGTDNDGVYGIDDKGKRVSYFYDKGYSNSAPNSAMSIYEDSNNNLWVGSYTKGLCILTPQTGSCSYVKYFNDKKIYCLAEDSNKNLLIGTHGSGMYVMNRKDKMISEYQYNGSDDNVLSPSLGNNWVNKIMVDHNGYIWIGHYRGINCFDPVKKTFVTIADNSKLLSNNAVFDIFEDEKKNIWIGTSEGLFVLEANKKQMRPYTESAELINKVICGISDDEEGNVWVSTYSGIYKLDILNKKTTIYKEGDGLQGDEFTKGAVFKDSNGKIYFGGTNGITCFFPSDIKQDTQKMKIELTGFYVSNKAIKQGDKSGGKHIITTSVQDADKFMLAYNDNTFSLEFSSFEFSNPQRISYQYKINELDAEWQNTISGTNYITYNNLPDGTYTLMIRSCDNGNYSEIKTLAIIISPPWFKTWWAYSLYLICILGVLWIVINYVISRIRYKQKAMESAYAEQINESKLQFFINISHEIRTPMTMIINPLEKLILENKDVDKQKTYTMIHRNAERILRLINQLMDIRKLDKGLMRLNYQETDIICFIKDIMLIFEYQAQKRNIVFAFEHQVASLKVWIDLNNFDKVLMNVLSNAFKYTPDNGFVKIVLSTAQNNDVVGALSEYFEISIIDNGIGIDADKIEAIFGRFYQINNDITNSTIGTGIGLHLSRQLVLLHQGIIYAENTETGSRFVVRIPLGKDHIDTDSIGNTNDQQKKVLHGAQNIVLNTIQEASNAKVRVKSKTKYQLLIVEDEDEIRSYLQEELSPFYKIAVCKNGKDALDFILKEKPDLVISDVMMPQMDGITLSKKMKANININYIPIILLTAKSREEDRLEGIETGADAYIIKPFNTEVLKQTVDNLIDNHRRLKNKYTGSQDQENRLQDIILKPADEMLMERVMKIVNDNISNSELNVEMLADKVGISRVHMYRKLKELTNMSTLEFIRNIRLKQAANLLENKKLSISDIAYATGFSNLSHFSSSFKEFYGVSPTEYMNSII